MRNMEERFTYTDTYARPVFDRGFTGHEHLQAFGLINMNGRMYDPVMSSFLSADRYMQDPTTAQGFNRYAYCMYNPLRYVDPSGWQIVLPPAGGSSSSADYVRDIYTYVDRPYEPRDFRNAYYMYNMAFYCNMNGHGGGWGNGFGSYGYYVTHCSNSVYNYHSLSSMLELIKNWQNNPSLSTGKDLVEAGISNLTVGELYGSFQGHPGYRNSHYTWTDGNGNEHVGDVLYEHVGGNSNGVFAVSNLPLELYGMRSSMEKAKLLSQSLGVPSGTLSESVEMAARLYHNTPLLKVNSGLTKAQKIAAISKEGLALSRMTKGLGIAGAVISSGITVFQWFDYRQNGGSDPNVNIKCTIDLLMTGVSFIGPVGFAIGTTYFIVDLSTNSFGGWGKIP